MNTEHVFKVLAEIIARRENVKIEIEIERKRGFEQKAKEKAC